MAKSPSIYLRLHMSRPSVDDGVRQAVRHGVDRARSYGIESEAGARVFVQLMFVLGPDFDVDPKLPWASRCLLGGADEVARVDAPLAAAREHLQHASAAQAGGECAPARRRGSSSRAAGKSISSS